MKNLEKDLCVVASLYYVKLLIYLKITVTIVS